MDKPSRSIFPSIGHMPFTLVESQNASKEVVTAMLVKNHRSVRGRMRLAQGVNPVKLTAKNYIHAGLCIQSVFFKHCNSLFYSLFSSSKMHCHRNCNRERRLINNHDAERPISLTPGERTGHALAAVFTRERDCLPPATSPTGNISTDKRSDRLSGYFQRVYSRCLFPFDPSSHARLCKGLCF